MTSVMLSSTDNPAGLVAEARRDPAAFAALYDRFVQPVYRYLYRRTGSAADAEDLTAQTFLAALEALPRYREQGFFAAWLFAIARSKAADYFRGAKPHAPLELAESRVALEAGDPLNRMVQREDLRRLSDLLASLTDDEHELIRLRYVAELTFGEIAAVLGKREDAVKKAIYRLLARLQRQMEATDD
jgi:RNA polymerase sigma-70 factor (ECF subfamily)